MISDLANVKKELILLMDKSSMLQAEKDSLSQEKNNLADRVMSLEQQVKKGESEVNSSEAIGRLERLLELREKECKLLQETVTSYEKELSLDQSGTGSNLIELISKYEKCKSNNTSYV